MGRRGNPHHKGKGRPDGGQFTSSGDILVRPSPMENDISSYKGNKAFGSRDPVYKAERVRNIKKALYDGGYVEKKSVNGYDNVEEMESFIQEITTSHASTEAWKDRKELVETYVKVAKGYIGSGKFDLVIDGSYSIGGERKATELMDEFGWSKKDVREILMASLNADSFVNSGANDSEYPSNKGTVVMVFCPRIHIGEKKKPLDLYVKMVLNPHPDRERNQTEMQVLSFREAGSKTCLYTGEKRVRNKREEDEK